ncbi:MAG TPA: PAC2 family protein [Chloroflexota bacterium]|jgi:predicted ATP-grasp superfamily ATP-dependent carboligase
MKIETADWRNPFLVAAFGGWGDAASVATTAASFLMQNRQSRRLGELDVEEYFVLTETRPLVRLDEAGQRRIQWPSLALLEGRGGERDAVILVGPEPQLRWCRFAREIAELWRERGQGGPVVLLGAFLAGISHAAPVVLTGFATTPELRERLTSLGIQPSGYQGPTGVHSALADLFREEGIPCLSIWAAVPHYLAALPNPKVCAALLRAVDQLLDLKLDLRELDDAARTFEKQVGLAMTRAGQTLASTNNPEPAAPAEEAEPLPPAEEVVEGVEEFFRRNRPAS